MGKRVNRETVDSEIHGLSDGDKCYGEKKNKTKQGRAWGLECKGERDGGGDQPRELLWGLSLPGRGTASAKALRWQRTPRDWRK